MDNLDDYIKAYGKDFAYALDNDLILNWYPKRIVEKKAGNSLLELGIGHGFTTSFFSKHFPRHIVIDGSSKVLEAFKTNYPELRTETVQCYFEHFETEEKFDHIVMGFVLEHVDDPKLILNRFRSFLKPNGKLFLTVPNAEALNKRIGLEAGIISDLYALGPGDLELGHKHLFSVNSLRELVRECGYVEKSLEGLFLKPFTTQQLKSMNLSTSIFEAMMKIGIQYPELSVGLLMELKANAE